jgi:adenylate kinase family enzyme
MYQRQLGNDPNQEDIVDLLNLDVINLTTNDINDTSNDYTKSISNVSDMDSLDCDVNQLIPMKMLEEDVLKKIEWYKIKFRYILSRINMYIFTGKNGAGKTTLAKKLVEDFNFLHFSLSRPLKEQCEKEVYVVNSDNSRSNVSLATWCGHCPLERIEREIPKNYINIVSEDTFNNSSARDVLIRTANINREMEEDLYVRLLFESIESRIKVEDSKTYDRYKVYQIVIDDQRFYIERFIINKICKNVVFKNIVRTECESFYDPCKKLNFNQLFIIEDKTIRDIFISI